MTLSSAVMTACNTDLLNSVDLPIYERTECAYFPHSGGAVGEISLSPGSLLKCPEARCTRVSVCVYLLLWVVC
jgi:hypothetical protein